MEQPIQSIAPMSLEHARAVIWPFRDIRGQKMGDLLDSGAISLQDLGFAAERAHNKNVQDAALTLLMHTLSNRSTAETSTSGPPVLYASPLRTFAQRREHQAVAFMGVASGTVFGFLIALTIFVFINALNEPSPDTPEASPIAWVIAILILFIVGYAYHRLLGYALDRFIFQPWENNLKLLRKGQQGEETVLNIFFSSLDHKWTIFRNVIIPGTKFGDIDLILVGPTGIWCFEVKNYSGEFRNIGDTWEHKVGSDWKPAYGNTSKQAKRNAARVSTFLKSHQLTQWVHPVIVWANPESTIDIQNPTVEIWRLDNLQEHLNGLMAGRPLAEETTQKIVTAIKSSLETEENQL